MKLKLISSNFFPQVKENMYKQYKLSENFNSHSTPLLCLIFTLYLLSTIRPSWKMNCYAPPNHCLCPGDAKKSATTLYQSSDFYFKLSREEHWLQHRSDKATYGRLYKFSPKFIHMHPKVGDSIQFYDF